jgi:pyridoxal phosphate enzyme (YggS family)
VPPGSPIDPGVVAANIAAVRARIAAHGGAGRTRLVAVTKGFGPDAIVAAAVAGADAVGENYAQELEDKLHALGGPPPLPVHFIGRIQRNKVRHLAPYVALWHSVDRVEVGAEIAKRAPGAAVLAQVNLSGESQKGGCEPADAPALVGALRDLGLDVRGLMGVAPAGPAESARPGFRRLADLAAELSLSELSMGMSDDLEVAVECGATFVRIGRSLFGARPTGREP